METNDIIKSKKQQIEDSIKVLHTIVLPNYKAEPSKFEDSEFNKNILYGVNFLKYNFELIRNNSSIPDIYHKAIQECVRFMSGSKYDPWLVRESPLYSVEYNVEFGIKECEKILDNLYYINNEEILDSIKDKLYKVYIVPNDYVAWNTGIAEKNYVIFDTIKYDNESNQYVWTGLLIQVLPNCASVKHEYYKEESFRFIHYDEKICEKNGFNEFFNNLKQTKEKNIIKDVVEQFTNNIKRTCVNCNLDKLINLFNVNLFAI